MCRKSIMSTLTSTQMRYNASIRNRRNPITIGTGPAGTGKTTIPCIVAAEMLSKREIKKILITRPAICADENHGFLPGTIESKMTPYLLPIFDCFNQAGINNDTIRAHLITKTIEICPFSFIRGRTFTNCFLLADETQNTTPNQMKMLLTRVGENCKMVLTGDLDQSDLPGPVNGLGDLVRRITNQFEYSDESCIDLVRMGHDDVRRSKIVSEVLKLYQI